MSNIDVGHSHKTTASIVLILFAVAATPHFAAFLTQVTFDP